MKLGFFGTPLIASYCMEALLKRHSVMFAVTPEDKPVGRSGKLVPPHLKETALKHNIPVFQPVTLKDADFIEKIKSFSADIYVVVAYGKLIPREIFDTPRFGTINLHPSLLPKYRGAAPIQWALINGESKTGVTVQLINEKMDAGDIVIQKQIVLDEMINAEQLYNAVLPIGAELLNEALKLFESGTASTVKQDESKASFCGKITRETAMIDWNNTSANIHNLVRGLSPKPAAWTSFRGMNFKIFSTSLFHESIEIDRKAAAGELFIYQKKRLLAETEAGLLEILELQPEAKSKMTAAAFINGYRITAGDCFK